MSIRIAARAVLIHDARLLLVNAWPGPASTLWCAPGGATEMHESLADGLVREVYEETGLNISVGMPCLINEFHASQRDFHQVEVFFRCSLVSGALDADWRDPEGIVTRRRWFSAQELPGIQMKPDTLRKIAFSDGIGYDPLEEIVE